MTFVQLPSEIGQKRLVFYLAMEEYLASDLTGIVGEGNDAFFLWQVPPTVIFGRNQVMEAEVNLQYCKEKGINLFRRKSGGGCVYSDYGNIMLSYITSSTDVAFTFDKYLQRLALAMRRAGLNAFRSGRKDILEDGKKVSGNSYCLQPSSSIVHGTMLFDTDFDELERAITPSSAKIRSKGVDSVRSHVTNIKQYFEVSQVPWQRKFADIAEYRKYLISEFCGNKDESGKIVSINRVTLTQEQVKDIEKIEAEYLDPDFLSGRKHSFTVERGFRIDGVGEFVLNLEMDMDKIVSCQLAGDYFLLKEGLNEYLSTLLKGASDTLESVSARLEKVDLEDYVKGLSVKTMLDKMYN